MNTELRNTMQSTIDRFVSPNAEILSIKDHDLAYGTSAVELKRHEILLRNDTRDWSINLISKRASLSERRTLNYLHDQSANVPFSFTLNMTSNSREYLCMQDVDYETDYNNLDNELLQKNEQAALADIHAFNFEKYYKLQWLPLLDSRYIKSVLNEKWGPTWNNAKSDPDFISHFGDLIPEIDKVAEHIVKDMDKVLRDESSHTLVHNDLHPGNTLVHKNRNVYFIDWEEAHYGSLYIDVALRYREFSQAENYRMLMNSRGLNLSAGIFKLNYTITSRYLGLRYMSWFLSTWKDDKRWLDELNKYINMTIS
ncbi:aminoglycoside phosphotransferase family protein [Paenibacillus polysaccharolyticus]|uniref:aminoglycoside phosphotransferase family protein n=1 Tax=Paenibacillus polysaccharolyticus TaxID=582692 RepID=UPI00203F7D1C|nr:aminoglycoside phosphotransferase family protein [Paenibacillus polysaccharolyticus]MCM3132118.1 aminoglycoside phosphotransferase family protein [Paenibacillus polysaccharolyticus]